jgi:hypothetical protein
MLASYGGRDNEAAEPPRRNDPSGDSAIHKEAASSLLVMSETRQALCENQHRRAQGDFRVDFAQMDSLRCDHPRKRLRCTRRVHSLCPNEERGAGGVLTRGRWGTPACRQATQRGAAIAGLGYDREGDEKCCNPPVAHPGRDCRCSNQEGCPGPGAAGEPAHDFRDVVPHRLPRGVHWMPWRSLPPRRGRRKNWHMARRERGAERAGRQRTRRFRTAVSCGIGLVP